MQPWNKYNFPKLQIVFLQINQQLYRTFYNTVERKKKKQYQNKNLEHEWKFVSLAQCPEEKQWKIQSNSRD